MDWLKIIEAAQAKQEALINTLKNENRAFSDEEKTNFDAWQKEIEDSTAMIEAENKLADTQNKMSAPVNTPTPNIEVGETRTAPFKNFGEQLKAIKSAAKNPMNADERLHALNAASGASEGIDEDGGFAVQTDFAGTILESAVQDSEVVQACDSYEVSAPANRVEWTEIDETSIATSVYGGVMAYWGAEAGTVASSKPKFASREIKLEKLMGIGYSTDELIQDTGFMAQLYSRSFAAAISRELESAIISGDGVGKPIGLLGASGTVTVAKETSQTADTVNWQNIQKMWKRSKPSKRNSYVWLAHPDLEEQFENFQLPIGDAGIPMSLLPGGVNMQGPSKIKGRPIIFTDCCEALGDKGDIYLANLNEYLLIRKGGVQEAQSMHVRFINGENTFRFTLRVNGMPKKNSALTIKNSASTRGDIITLAARA